MSKKTPTSKKNNEVYEFIINDYKFVIEYINLPNSTASGIVKIYKQNNYVSLFCSVIAKPNKEESSFLNLHVNFAKCPGGNKFNNDEVLISRAIDKSIRPLLNNSGHSIAINISVLQSQNWIDMKFASIFTSLAITKKIFNIDAGVASISIGKESLYCSKYDRLSQHSYIICTGSKTHMHFLEVESNKLTNIQSHLTELFNINNQISEELSKIKSLHKIAYGYDINHIKHLKNRIEKRDNLEYRKFDINTNYSNNSLVLNRGDTIILNNIYSKNGDFNFEHIYKSSSFASNEIQNKQSRREVGHGDLIHKALYSTVQQNSILKTNNTKIISYVLNANGSTSMASVMAGAMNLFKEGFITQNELLYGISFGVFMNENQSLHNIICDMTAREDNLSAMDFKIVQDGFNNIYAIQMDCRWPILNSIIINMFDIANGVFDKIKQDIAHLIETKHIQHNLKTSITKNVSEYLKRNSIIIISLKKILNHMYFDNKFYIHLQSNKINLNYISNFYMKEKLCVGDTVIFVIPQDIKNNTEISNNLHEFKFTRKQTLKSGDVIKGIVKDIDKISFVEIVS